MSANVKYKGDGDTLTYLDEEGVRHLKLGVKATHPLNEIFLEAVVETMNLARPHDVTMFNLEVALRRLAFNAYKLGRDDK